MIFLKKKMDRLDSFAKGALGNESKGEKKGTFFA